MWTARYESWDHNRGMRGSVDVASRHATFADVMQAWQTDTDFRAWFNALLADAPYKAYRWETPPVTSATVAQPFEFVLLDEPSLARAPDPHAFAEHFRAATDGVAVFANLGGDATMIVPAPLTEHSAYGHLAAFVAWHRKRSSKRSGTPSAPPSRYGSAIGRSGSAPRARVSRGCTSGLTIGPSIMGIAPIAFSRPASPRDPISRHRVCSTVVIRSASLSPLPGGGHAYLEQARECGIPCHHLYHGRGSLRCMMLVWYLYLRHTGYDGALYYVCGGFALTGLILLLIGFSLGHIGRSARNAELPPTEGSPTSVVREPAAPPTPGAVASNAPGNPASPAPSPPVAKIV